MPLLPSGILRSVIHSEDEWNFWKTILADFLCHASRRIIYMVYFEWTWNGVLLSYPVLRSPRLISRIIHRKSTVKKRRLKNGRRPASDFTSWTKNFIPEQSQATGPSFANRSLGLPWFSLGNNRTVLDFILDHTLTVPKFWTELLFVYLDFCLDFTVNTETIGQVKMTRSWFLHFIIIKKTTRISLRNY